MRPVSPEFAARYQQVLQEAYDRGLDSMETLNRHGLLATQERLLQARVAGLEDLSHRLDGQSAAKLLTVFFQRGYGSPEDAIRAVQMWVDDYIRMTIAGKVDE